jgi:spore germination protein
MIIHVVQPNETVYTIAQQYNISPGRLEQDNNLSINNILNVGQALMIAYPEKTYIAQEGDTASSVAETQGITMRQLLSNNPHLSEQSSLYPGEELIISYKKNNKKIKVIGYTPAYISLEVLRMTLPLLTYITIYNFKVTATGNFIDINDTEIIRMAKQYGVKPIMFLSALTDQGKGSYGTTHNILGNKKIQNILIDNILSNLKLKGYYGLNLAFHSILQTDMANYVEFVALLTNRLNSEGYEVFVTLTPATMGFKPDTAYQNSYFSAIGQATNNIILMTYLWASAEIYEVNETTASYLRKYLDYVVTQIPPEKIFIGLTRIAYDWEVPYIPGESIGSSLTNAGAINLANQLGNTIYFDETTQTPYYYYNDSGVEHYVWFKDARSIEAILNLINEYKLEGIAVWNIMYYYSQTWLSINSQYDIETIP